MSREMPTRPTTSPRLAAQRDLGRGDPALLAVGADDIFLAVDHRFAASRRSAARRRNTFPRSSAGCSSRSVLPIRSARRRQPDLAGGRVVGDEKAALGVLEPQIVGHEVDQLLQRQALCAQRAALVDRGDVAMGQDPSPAGRAAARISTKRPSGRATVACAGLRARPASSRVRPGARCGAVARAAGASGRRGRRRAAASSGPRP